MIRKFIAFQRLLLNSIPPPLVRDTANSLDGIIFAFMIVFGVINSWIFSGGESIPINFPIIIIWLISRILHNDFKLYQTVPVNNKYILINIYLLPIAMVVIVYIAFMIFNWVSIGLLFGILYLVYPQGFSDSPPEVANFQIIDSTKGNLLMLCLFIIIIFVGITITLIKNKKKRLFSYGVFAIISYGLLLFLKFNMPVSPNTGRVEFVDSFSIMPSGNIILISLAVVTLIIAIGSSFISYNIYVKKEM